MCVVFQTEWHHCRSDSVARWGWWVSPTSSVCVCVCVHVWSDAPYHQLNPWIPHIPAQSQAQVSPLVRLRWLTLFATIRHYYVIDLWPLQATCWNSFKPDRLISMGKALNLDSGLWKQSTPKGEGGEPGSLPPERSDPVGGWWWWSFRSDSLSRMHFIRGKPRNSLPQRLVHICMGLNSVIINQSLLLISQPGENRRSFLAAEWRTTSFYQIQPFSSSWLLLLFKVILGFISQKLKENNQEKTRRPHNKNNWSVDLTVAIKSK